MAHPQLCCCMQNVVNFALFASNATAVSLCLFIEDDLKQNRVSLEISLDPEENRTGDVWHIAFQDLSDTLLYAYRIWGPEDNGTDRTAGLTYIPDKIVLDPYSKSIYNSRRSFGQLAEAKEESDMIWPQAAALVPGAADIFDWEGDKPLEIPMEDLIIYEAHVRGFTADGSSGVRSPGTYAGMIEKLDYLSYLGINAVELLPIYEFNELEYYQISLGEDAFNRYNYWGYSTVGFFAPMARYSESMSLPENNAIQASRGVLHEFKTLVKECHKRGIEIILDVVFNHTAEGNEHGPTISFRGIDNRVYYMLAPQGEYYNYSGCGNTFNCNHPVAMRFIIDCLRYWVEEMHVDGFRFDLAAIMTRAHSLWHPVNNGSEESVGARGTSMKQYFPSNMSGEWSETSDIEENGASGHEPAIGIIPEGAGEPTGTPLSDPPLIAAISADPILSKTKLIAEAWDCDGLNQVGAFPHYGGRWSEWNGHFRDATRQFIKGTDGNWAGSFAASLCGSPNIYINEPGEHDWWGNNGGSRWKSGRGPTASINFITAHDGFSLADLVSYNEKHNKENGEDNRDGESHNLSWNCGAEGNTADLNVNQLRARQMRNFMSALLMSNGVPMILMGDEYGHTKYGNNNTYCHDSKLNYFDWDAARNDKDGLLRFTKAMIALRKRFSAFRRSHYVSDADIDWHGLEPGNPDWSEESRFLALTLKGHGNNNDVYVAFNTSHKSQLVSLPYLDGRKWLPLVDSGKVAPFDVLMTDERLSHEDVRAAQAALGMWTSQNLYPMLPWSCIVLECSETSSDDMPDKYSTNLKI
jgi:isoamylase